MHTAYTHTHTPTQRHIVGDSQVESSWRKGYIYSPEPSWALLSGTWYGVHFITAETFHLFQRHLSLECLSQPRCCWKWKEAKKTHIHTHERYIYVEIKHCFRESHFLCLLFSGCCCWVVVVRYHFFASFFRLFRLPRCVLFGPCSHQKLPRKAGRQAELMYGDSTKSAPACGRRRDKRQQKTHFWG